MRLLTGSDRLAYERLLREHAEALGCRESLQREIARLEARVATLEAHWTYERERGDRAADALLMDHGKSPIRPQSLPPEEADVDLFREDPEKVKEILARMGIGAEQN